MMRKSWLLAGAAVLVAAAATGAVIATSSTNQATAAGQTPSLRTATVERGMLSDQISQSGTLTYRARPDGSPYTVFNRVSGTYTELPSSGDHVSCGGVLYRVDNKPVLIMCGSTPAYRTLSQGDSGPDVAELNANLVRLGYATRAQLNPFFDSFGAATAAALQKLQAKLGEDQSGSLALGEVVFLPEAVRIATVSVELGASARPGAPVMSATSDTLEVQLALDPSQQGAVRKGDRAQITLPSNTTVAGRVDGVGRVAQAPAGQSSSAGAVSRVTKMAGFRARLT